MKQRFEEPTRYLGIACVVILVLIIAEVILLNSLVSPDAFTPLLFPEWRTLYTTLIVLFALGIVGAMVWVWYTLTHTRQSSTYGTAHFASKQEVRQAGVATPRERPSSNAHGREHRHLRPPERFQFVLAHLAATALQHKKIVPGTSYGIAPFIPSQEIEDRQTAVRNHESLFTLGAYRDLNIALPEEHQEGHVLVIAPTKRGKTAGIIIPNLLNERGSRSLFINDIKHELIDLCISALAEHHDCYILSPTRPAESNGYNPLAHVSPESLSDARNVAECIVRNTGSSKEPFWDNSARLLVTATILHLRATEPDAPFSRIADICTLSLSEIATIISRSPSALAQRIGASFVRNIAAEPKLQSNIMTDISTRLFDMMDPQVESITAYDDLNFQQLGFSPSALFLHIPPSQATRLRWLSSCLIMQLINYLFEHPHKQPFAFYLDELANIGYIPNYLEYISYIRSAKIVFLQVIQDFGQLERIYEEHGKDTILANSGTQIFLSGVGQVEAEYASRVMGDTTVLARSENDQERKVTYSEATRKLMNPDEIRNLPLWSLLVLMGNTPPFIVKNIPYFQQPELQARIRLPYMRPTRVYPLPSEPAPPLVELQPPPSQLPPRLALGDDEKHFPGDM